MSDDWDDGVPAPVFTEPRSPKSAGMKFSAGRGFTTSSQDNFNSGGDNWGEEPQHDRPQRGGRGGGGRGRGGTRGRGGGGGGGGFSDDRDERRAPRNDNNNAWGDKKEGDEKPRPPIYIPQERANDDELFTETIASGVNFIKFNEIEVKVTGEEVPPEISSFATSGLRPHLLKNVEKSGYTKLTPIQKHAIPIIMAGRDLMGCAQTGSGKTAAFLLPIIHNLMANQAQLETNGECCYPYAVIVSPTRELTIQIYDQAKKFAYNSIVKPVVAYGGTSMQYQRKNLMGGCHILVATPGRLNGFVEEGRVDFSKLQFVVLDEADRMLDMGFLPAVESMLSHPTMTATGERQTLMFSATFPEEIQHLAAKFLNRYVFVAVGIVGSASTDVEQTILECQKRFKKQKLLDMLKECNEKTLVFVETKLTADFLATCLSENDITATSIHGDRYQSQREQAIHEFKHGIRKILVATSVAARGLDIDGVQHVINYNIPKSIDEYVHRIGRTGRLGNKGRATSFYDSSEDGAIAGQLANILQQAGQTVPSFLAGGNSGGYVETDSYGGRDIRGDEFGDNPKSHSRPVDEIQEEDW